MKMLKFFIPFFFLALIVACQNQEDFEGSSLNDQNSSQATPYRHRFASVDDFKKYLSENEKSDKGISDKGIYVVSDIRVAL
ncbi:MAG: hypothetical protein LBS05_01910 [Tannerellaceae bacterium]|jgi:hypothetical protein|nr:hypothetical protein [Tannerellaceae bacterium]